MEIAIARYPEDTARVLSVVEQAAGRLNARGVDQWPYPLNRHWRDRLTNQVERGEFSVVRIDGHAIAVFRLTWQDDYWPDDGEAAYIHTIAVADGYQGVGIGEQCIRQAHLTARAAGRPALRLDCLATNSRLCAYYEQLGFVRHGTLVDRDYQAALYELR